MEDFVENLGYFLAATIFDWAALHLVHAVRLRYARVCSYKEDFIARAALLKRKLKEKGFTEERLRKTSRKCIHNNNWIIKKYQGSGFRAVDLHYC